jgi:hypothetical protein
MSPSLELPLERPFQSDGGFAEGPDAGPELAETKLPTEHGLRRWLLPLVDLISSSAALAILVSATGTRLKWDLALIPLLLVTLNGVLGVYKDSHSQAVRQATESRTSALAVRLLVGICFAWAASLLVPLSGGDQVALWASFVLLDTLGRNVSTRLIQRGSRAERWILVGDEATAERLASYRPLRSHATVVCAVVPPVEAEMDGARYRNGALKVVHRYRADRVVIASQSESDRGVLALVRAFKAIGVPVCLLPQPLDLVHAPSATPSRIAGLPLIEVEALAVHDALPYIGPDRRNPERRPQVSVVVPAMNEEHNIGPVLRQLPDGLHEVILVDGNSRDGTVAAAKRAYPSIRVVTQTGRGKGDALRSGFAAVSGNVIVMLDADGSADPCEIPRFVAALEAGADFAKGSRFIEGGGSADITALRRAGNAFLSLTVNTLHRTSFTDLCYGYNAFWTRCLPYISLDVPGFEVETHINLRIASAGMRITEVPSFERNRISGNSNLNTFRDGFRVLRTILNEARRNQMIRRGRPHHDTAGKAAERRALVAIESEIG